MAMEVGLILRRYSEPFVEHGWLIVALFAFCSAAFGVDISAELTIDLTEGDSFTFSETLHVLIEVLAELALLTATFLSFKSYVYLRHTSRDQYRVSYAIRTGFDKLIQEKFSEWNLTNSERDIALLAIRGLNVGMIAEARGSKIGTVKTHLHNLYAKTSVSSQTELLALFMDELLSQEELSASPTTRSQNI